MAEIIRGGFLAIPVGQRDAAKARLLSRWQVMSKVRCRRRHGSSCRRSAIR
jgi:ABC-type amino acid transport system permease subunit